MFCSNKKVISKVTALLSDFDYYDLERLSYKNKKFGVTIGFKNPKSSRPVHSVSVEKVSSIDAPISIKNFDTLTQGANIESSLYHKIVSPITGAYYGKPKPEDPSFVKEGTIVESHQTVCLLEAMKMFTEVKAGIKGKVVKIMREEGDFVAEGDTLFEIQPM
ncbi:MAG TPA: hypothetical protein DHW82_02965 [Spirochaetia bacterium]|nr:hypothetical protein [Spirochaetia bacterium]